MNAVEIEEAISELAGQPFEAGEFAFDFLEAFGNKPTTIRRLRSGSSNSSDIAGGVLQRTNIHIAVCHVGDVPHTLAALKASPATAKAKAKFVLATDGVDLEAEDLGSGETVACSYPDFPNHFGFFLPLAGITTVKQIRNNPIDIQATGRLNRLYVELLKENPDWDTAERRNDMNQFMARLIFCFFAEDTDIFRSPNLFTHTVEQMSEARSGNTHEVIAELFRAMDTPTKDRGDAGLPRWADAFPWVNGGLFDGAKEVPRFSRIARSYLLHAGRLDWQKINPDIFGSMIQAVAEDEERGELGLHYTSVPNILKVLSPLFLDDLRDQLEKAGNNSRKLLNLRKRIARIRVFDPACGSGNFLVIAYIQMREIESEILHRRSEEDRRSWIPLENFYGIEIKDFACEVARLSLLIAEFQCDVRLIGQKEAKELVLPLKQTGQIHYGNALHMDWLKVCPPVEPIIEEHDLAGPTGRFALGDAEEPEVETYICGNPPYKGSKWQSPIQKEEMARVWHRFPKLARNTDYVSGWLAVFGDYFGVDSNSEAAFVMTNSVCQGQQASDIWPRIFSCGIEISFAHRPIKWNNLASDAAGVTVIIIGLRKNGNNPKFLFEDGQSRKCTAIGPYLVPDRTDVVHKCTESICDLAPMLFGNMPRDGGGLFLSRGQYQELTTKEPLSRNYLRRFLGSEEVIHGKQRYCVWIEDHELINATRINDLKKRLEFVKETRSSSAAASTRQFALRSHRFVQIAGQAERTSIVIPRVSSENRDYLPVGFVDEKTIIGDRNFAIYDGDLWSLALIASRLHWVWIGTVCVRLEMRFSYSNTLGWNTFPVPTLTEQNKADLTHCAEDILLARESHFPATIADLYNSEEMPEDLRSAHERNDEVLERIYIGRRFRNDTERLETLFDLYAKKSLKKAKAGRKRTEHKSNSRQVNEELELTESQSSRPGWDAKAIAEIAKAKYGDYAALFEAHGWPERGPDMMRKVQTRVTETYGSVEAFVEHHGK